MGSPIRRSYSYSTPGASSLVGLSSQVRDDFRWPAAKPSQVYSRFVRDSFYPAKVQLQRSQSAVNFGSYVPDSTVLGPSYSYRSQFGLLEHPSRFKPGVKWEDGQYVSYRARTSPRRVYGDYHWPYYRRYIADEWNYFGYDAERAIDSANTWRIYAPVSVTPSYQPYPYYGINLKYDSYSIGPSVTSYGNLYWRDYFSYRNYMSGLSAGGIRRGVPFWKRVYSSIYPPLWHLSPLNHYYTHGYY